MTTAAASGGIGLAWWWILEVIQIDAKELKGVEVGKRGIVYEASRHRFGCPSFGRYYIDYRPIASLHTLVRL